MPGNPFSYMAAMGGRAVPPPSIDYTSDTLPPAATDVGQIYPNYASYPGPTDVAASSLLPAPQRPLAGRLTDPITQLYRNIVTQKTGLRYGVTPTGDQAWYPPQAGETWLGGRIAGIDPVTGAPVYNPLGYGSLLEAPQGSQPGRLASALRSLYHLVSGRSFGVTPSGSQWFTPVAGERWIGGGIAGIDPRTGRDVYNPLGYGQFAQQVASGAGYGPGLISQGGGGEWTQTNTLPSIPGPPLPAYFGNAKWLL